MGNFLQYQFEEKVDFINEKDFPNIPYCLSPYEWRSYNSDYRDLTIIGNFIKEFRPTVVLECGTFEGRGTEYIARKMIRYCPEPRTLITIDAYDHIDHLNWDENLVTYNNPPGWEEVQDIRNTRMKLLSKYPKIKVVPLIGLTKTYLRSVLDTYDVQFIYQDASHLTHILIEEWKLLTTCRLKEDLIICFDDMNGSEFVPWFKENVKGWYSMNSKASDRGQMWVEQVDK